MSKNLPRKTKWLALLATLIRLIPVFYFAETLNLTAAKAKSPDYVCIGRATGTYMNEVIAEVSKFGSNNRIRLLSPAFNMTSPYTSQIIAGMGTTNPNFNHPLLIAIAGNSYNVDHRTITDYAEDFYAANSNLFAGKPMFLTEIGMIETDRNGVDRNTGMNNLRNQIAVMRDDNRYLGALLFDSMLRDGNREPHIPLNPATNPDPDFKYNWMMDSEITSVCGNTSCGKIGINFATYYTIAEDFYARADKLGMSYSLEIATNDTDGVLRGISYALTRGMTPVIRIGVGMNSGGFDQPSTYASFLRVINNYVNTLIRDELISPQSLVYAIAGPNEPDIEYWIAPNCVTGDTSRGDPRQGDFTDPLLYPCDTVTNNEHHPLRPYPGSPCDPLIPSRPREPGTFRASEEHLTFSCGTSVNVRGSYRLRTFSQNEVTGLPLFPDDPVNATPETYYRCGGNVCTVRRVGYNITIDLANAELPVAGNTQDAMDDATKMNHYLSWYLNGAIQHSDQREINPENPGDIHRLINFSGPIKKLLPYSALADIQTQVALGTFIPTNPQTNDDLNALHRYLINPPLRLHHAPSHRILAELLENIPFSSLEDITGEVIVSVIPNQQPGPNEPRERSGQLTLEGQDYVIPQAYNYSAPDSSLRNQAAVRLRIRPNSDSRLYFPHLRGLNFLSQTLRSISVPKTMGSSRGLDPVQGIAEHQGQPPVPGADRSVEVQIDREERGYRGRPGVITRNTELFDPAVQNPPVAMTPAPSPSFTNYRNWYALQDAMPQDQRCTILETRLLSDNPGDTLYGRRIEARLNYTQVFNYPPAPPPAGGSGCTSNTGCSADNCCAMDDDDGRALGLLPACPGFSCEWRQGCDGSPSLPGCQQYCDPNPSNREDGCGTFVRSDDFTRPTVARVAVFIKTPLVDRIYETLVSGRSSILRRYVPKAPDDHPYDLYDYIAGEIRPDGSQDLTRTRPVSSSVNYFGSHVPEDTTESNRFTHEAVTGGAAEGGSPRLYFPRLGSLFDYFLGADQDEQLNLQRILRPKGLGSATLSPDPRLGPSLTCAGYDSTQLSAAASLAAAKYNVPASQLLAIHNIEHFGYVLGESYNCQNNSSFAAGPMQIVRNEFVSPNNSTYHLVTCPEERIADSCTQTPGRLSRCHINDAMELAARVLLSKVGRWNYTECRATGSILATNLSDVYNSSCRYYGSFRPDTATHARGNDNPSLTPRSDNSRFNYCDVVCGRMSQSNSSLNYCPPYPPQQPIRQ